MHSIFSFTKQLADLHCCDNPYQAHLPQGMTAFAVKCTGVIDYFPVYSVRLSETQEKPAE